MKAFFESVFTSRQGEQRLIHEDFKEPQHCNIFTSSSKHPLFLFTLCSPEAVMLRDIKRRETEIE